MIHLFVEFRDHYRLDDGQQFGHGQRRDAQGATECKRSRQVPSDYRARQYTQLPTEATNQVPDLPAFKGGGSVQPRRAVFAGRLARAAVALAPAEGPFGESAETFFSCSKSRPLET